ncbi:hypothetical protein, partial [Paenibacillus popilliae]|uniref:hypothetical protein n=1 Tax=Paenibacillus popilliae TaxID=78057 RepID=UPI001F329BDD
MNNRQFTLKLEQARENFIVSVRSGNETEKAKKIVEESSLQIANYSNDSYFKVMQEIEQSEYQLAEQSKELEE